ncbi:MAG: isoprenylcysteine carboxylmethyltransferase family protein [Pirellulales bacterium]|nr:isoprenylcysteine carboxylmethyltransferase family protein [Pirellulales bacterium]
MSSISLTSGEVAGQRRFAERGRAVIGIAILAPFAVAGLFHTPLGESQPWLKLALDALGWAFFVAGTGLRLWATLYIGGHKGKELVSEGPYSLCRNPLYLGIFLLVLSIAFFLGSPLLAIGLGLALLVYLRATVASEERRLQARQGAVFDEYCARVPRFWPRFDGFRAGEKLEIDLRTLWLEARRALRWCAIPLACELVRLVESLPGWPRLF